MLEAVLSVVTVLAAAAFGFAIAHVRVHCSVDPLTQELRGWLRCERALAEELDDRALLRRVRTRVPPDLRMQYERAMEGAAAPAREETNPTESLPG